MKENIDKALLAGHRALTGAQKSIFSEETLDLIKDNTNLAVDLTDVMGGTASDLFKLANALRCRDYETVAEIFRSRLKIHRSLVDLILGA